MPEDKSCTDLHFRGLSQQINQAIRHILVARTSISEAFRNIEGLPLIRPEVARTSISEAFHNVECGETAPKIVARTSISEAFHNPIRFIFPSSPFIY